MVYPTTSMNETQIQDCTAPVYEMEVLLKNCEAQFVHKNIQKNILLIKSIFLIICRKLCHCAVKYL